MLLKTRLFGQVYSFDSVKDVLNKGSSKKSGDELVGIAAGNEQERIAAQIVISNMQVSDFRNNPIIPYEEDFVTRIIQDDLNENVYEEIKNWTIEELREFLLSDKSTERDIKRISRGLTAETISAVCKIMGNLDLAYAARRIRNETTCNTTMGKEGILASRLQPNHPPARTARYRSAYAAPPYHPDTRCRSTSRQPEACRMPRRFSTAQ